MLWKVEINISKRWLVEGFFPPLHQLVLHTAPWVDGAVGHPLSTPTAQCAAPQFGLLPILFAASPSQICLFFVASLCRYQRCQSRTIRLWDHMCAKTMGSSIKSNKTHWPWSKLITLIICCWTSCTLLPKKQRDTVFSPPWRQIAPLYWFESRLKATEYQTIMQARSCKGLKPSNELHASFDSEDCNNKAKMCEGRFLGWLFLSTVLQKTSPTFSDKPYWEKEGILNNQ